MAAPPFPATAAAFAAAARGLFSLHGILAGPGAVVFLAPDDSGLGSGGGCSGSPFAARVFTHSAHAEEPAADMRSVRIAVDQVCLRGIVRGGAFAAGTRVSTGLYVGTRDKSRVLGAGEKWEGSVSKGGE